MENWLRGFASVSTIEPSFIQVQTRSLHVRLLPLYCTVKILGAHPFVYYCTTVYTSIKFSCTIISDLFFHKTSTCRLYVGLFSLAGEAFPYYYCTLLLDCISSFSANFLVSILLYLKCIRPDLYFYANSFEYVFFSQ